MKPFFVALFGLLLLAGLGNSLSRRHLVDYLIVDNEESNNEANEAAAGYTKVVKFYARSFRDGIIGGSNMQFAADGYSAGSILFITNKMYDKNRQFTYEFIKDGEIVHQETVNFLSDFAIQDLIEKYLLP